MSNEDTNSKDENNVWPPLALQQEVTTTESLDKHNASGRRGSLDVIAGFLIPVAASVLPSLGAIVGLGKFVNLEIRPEFAIVVLLSIVMLLCGVSWRLRLDSPIPYSSRVAKGAWMGILIGIGASAVLGFEAYISHITAHPWPASSTIS